MKLTLKQAAEIHAAAEEIAQYCSSVSEAHKLPEEARILIHATAMLAAMMMAERVRAIME